MMFWPEKGRVIDQSKSQITIVTIHCGRAMIYNQARGALTRKICEGWPGKPEIVIVISRKKLARKWHCGYLWVN